MKCLNCGCEFTEGLFCPECGSKYNSEEIETDKTVTKENAGEKKIAKSEQGKTKSILNNKIYGWTVLVAFIIVVILAAIGKDDSVLGYIAIYWSGIGIPVWIIWKIVLRIKR